MNQQLTHHCAWQWYSNRHIILMMRDFCLQMHPKAKHGDDKHWLNRPGLGLPISVPQGAMCKFLPDEMNLFLRYLQAQAAWASTPSRPAPRSLEVDTRPR